MKVLMEKRALITQYTHQAGKYYRNKKLKALYRKPQKSDFRNISGGFLKDLLRVFWVESNEEK